MQVKESHRHEVGSCCSSVESSHRPEFATMPARSETQAAPHSHAGEIAIGSLDNLGMAASTICLIHCLAMPVIITILPIMGWQFLESKNAHYVLACFVFAFALFAIVPGYIKHKRASIFWCMIAGLSLVLTATFVCGRLLPETIELPLITAGNLILVATHWQNRKLSTCQHSH